MMTPKKTTKGTAVAVLAMTLLGAGLVASSHAAPLEMKFGSTNPLGSITYLTDVHFIELMKQRASDKVDIEYYPNTQIGTQKEQLQKLKLGTQALASISSIMTSLLPEMGLYDMPYLVKDRVHAGCISKKLIFPDVAPKLEKKGYKLIGVWENGFRQISNNVRPIKAPADLSGIKLRTPRGVWRIKMFKEYGANPTPMPFSEVFVALQTGVMDGQENPYSNIWSGKFFEVQKYVSETNHVYSPLYLVMSKIVWDDLSADLQKTFLEAAVDTQAYAYKKAADIDKDIKDKIIKAGVAVNEADRDAFVKASKPVYAAFGQEVAGGSELIEKALGLVDACR